MKRLMESKHMREGGVFMNIIKMTDEEFEEYLKLNIDNLTPEELLTELIECGLSEEKQTYYEVEENYYEKDNSFDCSYSMTIHKTSWLDKFIRNKKNISLDEKMRRAA